MIQWSLIEKFHEKRCPKSNTFIGFMSVWYFLTLIYVWIDAQPCNEKILEWEISLKNSRPIYFPTYEMSCCLCNKQAGYLFQGFCPQIWMNPSSSNIQITEKLFSYYHTSTSELDHFANWQKTNPQSFLTIIEDIFSRKNAKHLLLELVKCAVFAACLCFIWL